MKQCLQFASRHSIRPLCAHSATLNQLFARKDAFTQMYTFLLSSRGSVTEASRLQYRNALMLALADFISGAVFGIIFVLFANTMYRQACGLIKWITYDFFEDYLDWFMGWPAGFKFNANLTRFIGRFFLSLLRTWKALLWTPISLNTALHVVSTLKQFGFSVLIALVVDLFSIATLHIRFFNRLIRILYRAYFCCLLSLFRLFQGQKWNTLRHRVDSATYSMDQLLVGMLLFSMLLCTFPTVCAYYLLFGVAWGLVLVLQCTARSIALFFTVLPLFSLLQRNSAFLSEGIKLQPLRLSSPPAFMLQMEPVSLGKLLKSFFDEQTRIWTSVFNADALLRFITGK